jgi:chromosome segregation ATPase
MAQKKRYEEELEALNSQINPFFIEVKATKESLHRHFKKQELQARIRNLNSQIRAIKSQNVYAPVGRGKVRLRTGNDDQP